MRRVPRPILAALCAVLLSGGAVAATAAAGPGVTAPRPPVRDPITGQEYPAHWWTPVPPESAASWEILPQAAKPGEVIVSKRHELGLLSNFAATPFRFHGRRYASVEGLWQSMLYPEGPRDPRARAAGIVWPYTRDSVERMTAFAAKHAGELAERNMKAMGITWVSFHGRRFPYRSRTPGWHDELILAAMRAKLEQNPEVCRALLATGNLVLKPDHHQAADDPPEWRYCTIWMQLRGELRQRLAKRDVEVWEAAFRGFLAAYDRGDGLYFLSVGGADPPDGFLDRFPAWRTRLRPRSQSFRAATVRERNTGREGKSVTLGAVHWCSPTEAVVSVGSWYGNLGATGDQFRVTLVKGRWIAKAFGIHVQS